MAVKESLRFWRMEDSRTFKSEGNRVLIKATIMTILLVVIIPSQWFLNALSRQPRLGLTEYSKTTDSG